jgi:RimJ/RimL family protein N-acetyltransferase
MTGPVFLEADDVTLRVPGEDDLDFLTELVNDPEVWPSLMASRPKTRTAEREFVESLADSDEVHLLICPGEEPAGIIGLNDVNQDWGVAELGYMLAPEAWGNGYATDAARRLVRYGFEDLRLHKIKANAYESNPASRRVLEKVGFEEEGLFRDHAYVRGEYVDVHRYGLLAEEFES